MSSGARGADGGQVRWTLCISRSRNATEQPEGRHVRTDRIHPDGPWGGGLLGYGGRAGRMNLALTCRDRTLLGTNSSL